MGRPGRPSASDSWGVGSFLSLGRPTCACVCGVLGHLPPAHRCARSVRCFACAVSWATWLLFTDMPARCVVLRVRCPGPLGSCSPVCPLRALLCVCGVLGHLAPVQGCARVVCCVASGVSWATWLLFTGAPARCVALLLRYLGPLGSCSPVCLLGAFFCLCGVLGQLAPVHKCARSVYCVVCAVFWATWLLFTGVPAQSGFLRVRCPEPLGSCSPVRPPSALLCWCGVLGHLAPVHRCARPVRCFDSAVFWATWLLFTRVPARCVVLRVRCPGPPDSCSPVCLLGALLCVCGVLGHLAPVHRCARVVCCVASTVSWVTWLLVTGAPARCVALRLRCTGPLGSCSPMRPLRVLLCVCRVVGHLAPVHRCACLLRCFVNGVSWATWLLFTCVPARCVVLRVRCPGPLGSCSRVCPLGVLLCVCRVLGHLAPVHRFARVVCCVVSTVSWATWLLFTGVPARCVVLCVRCPGPLGSCSRVCPLGVWCCMCGVLGHLAPVQRCVRVVCCVASTVSWATWLLFTGVPAQCVALLLRCPGSLGSCSRVCPLGALLCCCGVLGHLAPVYRCARSVCCVACAVSWATWLLFTGVRCVACAVSWATWLLFTGVGARFIVLRVRCPEPLGSRSPVCLLRPLLCWCGVRTTSLATWPLFTGVLTPCAVLCVRCPGPFHSCSPVCLLRPVLCSCGVLGHLAPVHRCACSVCCVACTLSSAPWLLFTGVLARCAVLGVRCLGSLASRSPVCSLGVLCCGLRVWGVAAGRTLVHPDGGYSWLAGAEFAAGRALFHVDSGCS